MAHSTGRPTCLWGTGLFISLLLISAALLGVSNRKRSVFIYGIYLCVLLHRCILHTVYCFTHHMTCILLFASSANICIPLFAERCVRMVKHMDGRMAHDAQTPRHIDITLE